MYTKRASFYHALFVDFLRVGKTIENFLRKSDYVKPHFKILDAGCGTGNVTRALYTIAKEKRYEGVVFNGFDLTVAMLDLFQKWIEKVGATNITLKQINVLNLEQLPSDWNGYDRIVSLGMLEHLPKDKLGQALRGLQRLLKDDGKLLVVIAERNFISRFFVSLWWKYTMYEEKELREIFHSAGFNELNVMKFSWYSMFMVEARK
ncbi:MAG TPA: class I SAM-dependent methyltransferase [Candidatus Paceibacterota bacterium]|nr:class I SAM-dependent methyltransferase [Candidatus Paceibacterota bacterium]